MGQARHQGAAPSTPPSSGGRVVTGYVHGVARQITLASIPGGKQMRSDAAAAFNRMHAAASRAGINLPVVSAFRTMEQQRDLYRKYLNGTGNLAAKPGYSNHQGGIAVDVTVGSTSTSTYKWLATHASRFGFAAPSPPSPGTGDPPLTGLSENTSLSVLSQTVGGLHRNPPASRESHPPGDPALTGP